MRRSANRAARYAAQTGPSSRKCTRKWHYIFGKSRNSISLPTRNQRLARNLPMGLSKLGLTKTGFSMAKKALFRRITRDLLGAMRQLEAAVTQRRQLAGALFPREEVGKKQL